MNPVHSNEISNHYKWGQNCDGWWLLQSEAASVKKERMPEGTSEQLHFHAKATQWFHILSGTSELILNGERHIVLQGQSIQVDPLTWHSIKNLTGVDMEFILVSVPDTSNDRFELRNYAPELDEAIKSLNYAWIQKYFSLEQSDIDTLSDPGEKIVKPGGLIYCIRAGDKIVGTVSLLKISDTIFELAKMAVAESHQGKGIGHMLIQHCIYEARRKGINKLILYSNTTLGAAIHLYSKSGFTQVEFEQGHYMRSNIKMEMVIQA